jgi:HEPN domain-containing protein
MNDPARAWLEFSARDLAAAEALQGNEYLANVALFHAQQAVEKALKAVIEHHGRAVPRIHSVRTLLERVIEASGSREKPDTEDVLLLD